MNVCVWGNCQTAILGLILKDALPDAHTEVLPEVQTVAESDEDIIYSKLHAADVIFVQRVQKSYRYEWLSTEAVKRAFKDKAISFPNAYFDGYFPGLGSAYTPDRALLAGPLGFYHFLSIVESYNRGETLAEATQSFTSTEQAVHQSDTTSASLDQLRTREAGLDVIVSDALEERWRSMRLFYSQNHPKNALLVTLAKRLLARARIRSALPQPYRQTQRLDRIDIPTQPHVREKYALEYEDTSIYRGTKFSIEGKIAKSSGTQTYSAAELVEQFFRLYETVGGVKHAGQQGERGLRRRDGVQP
jgi:hypothetical protein